MVLWYRTVRSLLEVPCLPILSWIPAVSLSCFFESQQDGIFHPAWRKAGNEWRGSMTWKVSARPWALQRLPCVVQTSGVTWPSCLPGSASYGVLPPGSLPLWACTKGQGEDMPTSESGAAVDAVTGFREQPVWGKQAGGWAGHFGEGCTDDSCYGLFCHQGPLTGPDQSVWIRNCWLCQPQTLYASAAQLLATLPPPSPG